MKELRWLVVFGLLILARAGSAGSEATNSVAEGAIAGQSKSFRTLPVLERNAILSDIRQRSLPEIFELWQRAGVIEKDLMKQGAIATTMAFALRERSPSGELLDAMWQYVVNPQNSLRERGGVLGMFGGAKTVEAVEFLQKASRKLTDPQLRRIAANQIAAVGDLRSDGSRHEERSVPLEKVWQTESDPALLSPTAIAMAKIGAPSAIEALLKAALNGNATDRNRRRAALDGLAQVYSRNAIPPVAGLLARQTGANEASALACKILVNIGDESAAKALIGWFQGADASVVELAKESVIQTRTPALLDAWNAVVVSKETFRQEAVRTALREALENRRKAL
jgi:hypothetical protein